MGIAQAQNLAGVLLEAEAKLGEMLAGIEPVYSMGSVEGTNRPHREKTLPPTITKEEIPRRQGPITESSTGGTIGSKSLAFRG